MNLIQETKKAILACMNDFETKQVMLKSMKDVHHPDLFSLVVDDKDGNLTRVFIALKEIKPFAIKLHSHTYDLKLAVVSGVFQHFQALELGNGATGIGSVLLNKYQYKSVLKGGDGLTLISENTPYGIMQSYIPPTGEIHMTCKDIHTVAVEEGTIWIVQEHGVKKEASIVLGEKFTTENLYNDVHPIEIDDMMCTVLKAIDSLGV